MQANKTAQALGMKDSSLFREKAYIDGQWVSSDSGETDEVLNPANGEVLGTVPRCGAAETRRAIEAANRAWPAWRSTPAKERGKTLRRWYELMMENQEDLAILMTAEQGKPLEESRGEIVYASSFFEWFGEEAKRAYGETIPTHMPDRRLLVIKQGIGVTAAITPWNFPFFLALKSILYPNFYERDFTMSETHPVRNNHETLQQLGLRGSPGGKSES